MIAAPEGANDTHLQALAARLLIDPEFVGKLKEAETPEAVQALFQAAEDQKKRKKSRTRTNNASTRKQS